MFLPYDLTHCNAQVRPKWRQPFAKEHGDEVRRAPARCEPGRSGDDVFVGAEFAQAHRSARVQAVGADADLGGRGQFKAVVEPRAGVPENRGAVHAAKKRCAAAASRVTIASLCAELSRLIVAMASSTDETRRTPMIRPRNSAVKSPAAAARCARPCCWRIAALAGSQRSSTCARATRGRDGAGASGHAGVHEQLFGSVAHAGALHLRIDDDLLAMAGSASPST